MDTDTSKKRPSIVSFLKENVFGKDFSINSPADVMYALDLWKDEIVAKTFHPLVALTGGISFVPDRPGKEFAALLICNDWINICNRIGANVKNSCTCLAFNFDDHQGLVALSMEVGSVSLKETSDFRMTNKEHAEFLNTVFVKNVGNIGEMATEWGVKIEPREGETPAESRTFWKEKLGHDVLIHPVTLKPCTDKSGKILRFEGIIVDDESEECVFKFIGENGKEFFTKEFPEIAAA